MNPFEMVVLIVAITAVAGILRTRYTNAHRDAERPGFDPAATALRDELRQLRERVAVLERIVTENNRGLELDREIERLRDRP